MCGRYNFTVEQNDELWGILEKLKLHEKAVKSGEIYPTDRAPILILGEDGIFPVLSSWGFPRFDRKGVIINARAESAFEKNAFRDGLINRRCIIPSTGFYEWDNKNKKFLFRMEGMNVLYMAGIYQPYADGLRHTILTTAANESVADIHSRMPLVIPAEDLSAWITGRPAAALKAISAYKSAQSADTSFLYDMLRRIPPQLTREAV